MGGCYFFVKISNGKEIQPDFKRKLNTKIYLFIFINFQVRNLSPFSFMHQDDVRWVIVALRQMYDCNSDTGESFYRLLSRNGNFIYLRTRGYLEIDRATNKVHSFVCVNTLLDEEEGKRKVQEMKNKFSIIINAKVPTGTMQDATASQNPQQLEKIVLYLIENLQKRQTNSCVVDEIHSEDDVKRHTSTPPLALVPPEPSSVKTSISKSVSVVIATAAKSLVLKSHAKQSSCSTNSHSSSTDHSLITDGGEEHKKSTTSLEIKSESDLTRAHPQQRPSVLQMRSNMCQETISSVSRTPETTEPAQSTEKPAEFTQHISVLKRRLHSESEKTTTRGQTISPPLFINDGEEDAVEDECSTAKRSPSSFLSDTMSSPNSISASCISPAIKHESSSDIHHFISDSLHHADEALNCFDVHNTTDLLRHSSNLSVSSGSPSLGATSQMDAIILEQHRQNEFLVNIKNEYDIIYKEQYIKSSPNRTEFPSPDDKL